MYQINEMSLEEFQALHDMMVIYKNAVEVHPLFDKNTNKINLPRTGRDNEINRLASRIVEYQKSLSQRPPDEVLSDYYLHDIYNHVTQNRKSLLTIPPTDSRQYKW
jgi:hypothetical protein